MTVASTHQSPDRVEADAVVVGVAKGKRLTPAAAEIDRATGGALTRLLENGEITGALYESTPLHAPQNVKAGLVLVMGMGELADWNSGLAYRVAAAASRCLASRPRNRVAFYLNDAGERSTAAHGIAGALSGCQGQDLYRTDRKRFSIPELLWAACDARAADEGLVLGESVNLARRLVNEPPQEMYPESFAAEAARLADKHALEHEIWDEDRLVDERCGSLLAVARGSERPPRMVILRHQGGAADEPPLAIVGKGVTFDSGGLSLKPNDGMKTMKCDMAGAATMLAAMTAIARLKLPVNVMGLAGLVENMPSGTAMKLGDVLRARTGKTIEVQNTDAEGRLVLADVLSVAVDRGAGRLIDLATLTGACVVALGPDVAGLMTNNSPWRDVVSAAAAACGEPLWELPMFAEYREHIASEVADIRNTGEGRYGGAIAAAKFLEEFVSGVPWVHLDIAGPAFSEKPKPWLDGGASGCFVRTLVEVARRAP